MESNANNGPMNHDPNPSTPSDLAAAGPINPATGQPNHDAEVSAVKSWFRENMVSLVLTVAAVAAICTWFDPIDTLMVVVGLGFIIFIHELGHFVAAKWCDVHVRTFSIGFGPAVPFCSYKWGETTYMVGIIPLGGYVQMVGEGEAGEGGEEEAEDDPRSFKKKSVGQRMVIISAGVVMNVILGMACFVAAYLHGVKEKPATVGSVESGGAAWRAGMRSGDHIVKIDSRENPTFDDLRPIVMSSDKGEQLDIAWTRGSERMEGKVSPIRDEGQRFPQLGVASPSRLELLSGIKQKVPPFYPGTPAADAKGSDGKGFLPGDRIIGMSDPTNPSQVTPVADFSDYNRRMVLLAKTPITFRVQRKGSDATADLVVAPAFRHGLGTRMRMGEVVALRKGGPAEKAGVVAHLQGPPLLRGDRIVEVGVSAADGKPVRFVAGDKTSPLDPILLPRQLEQWAATNPPSLKVELVVLREGEHTEKRQTLTLDYQPGFRFDREQSVLPNSPLSVSGLGLAYWVEAVIDDVTPGGPAATAVLAPGDLDTSLWHRFKRMVGLESRDVSPGGTPMPLKTNDVITAVRFRAGSPESLVAGKWKDDLKYNQWASVDSVYQINAAELELRVKRGDEVFTVLVKGQPNPEWGLDDRGLIFMPETQVQQAANIGDAMRLGALRTVRFIKTVYMSLYGYINGRISVKTLSGPLTIANVSYKLAGEDFWQFLLFLGMISVNLAVVNFLPIPVLDGGHMVFLILEKILGRPVPERMFAFAMYAGLFLILGLMVFVLFLDVGRLFFGAF